MKNEKKSMADRVRERANNDYQTLFNKQIELRQKQKQIVNKLCKECEEQGIVNQLFFNNMLDVEVIYEIHLSYDLADKTMGKIYVYPVKAKLNIDDEPIPVYFTAWNSKVLQRMTDVATLFKTIEDDMYKYYSYNNHE